MQNDFLKNHPPTFLAWGYSHFYFWNPLVTSRHFNFFFFTDIGTSLEPPTVYLWTLFFLSQHYDQTGDHVKALDYVDRAITHTPTHIELYMFKSKIFKVYKEVKNGNSGIYMPFSSMLVTWFKLLDG